MHTEVDCSRVMKLVKILGLLFINDFSFTSRDASVSKVSGYRQYQRDLTSFQ
jgi:hypothetical protein